MSAAPAAAQEGWTGVVTEFGAGTDPHLGADPVGNVFLVWAGGTPSSIRARRYSQATSTWGPEKIIAAVAGSSVAHESGNVLVVNADGRAAFVWWSGNSVQVSSYDVATDAWTSPAVILTVDSVLRSR